MAPTLSRKKDGKTKQTPEPGLALYMYTQNIHIKTCRAAQQHNCIHVVSPTIAGVAGVAQKKGWHSWSFRPSSTLPSHYLYITTRQSRSFEKFRRKFSILMNFPEEVEHANKLEVPRIIEASQLEFVDPLRVKRLVNSVSQNRVWERKYERGREEELTLYLRNRGDSPLSDCGHELRQ